MSHRVIFNLIPLLFIFILLHHSLILFHLYITSLILFWHHEWGPRRILLRQCPTDNMSGSNPCINYCFFLSKNIQYILEQFCFVSKTNDIATLYSILFHFFSSSHYFTNSILMPAPDSLQTMSDRQYVWIQSMHQKHIVGFFLSAISYIWSLSI